MFTVLPLPVAFQPEERMCTVTFLSNPSHTCYPRIFWGDVKAAGLQRPHRTESGGEGSTGRLAAEQMMSEPGILAPGPGPGS